MTPSDSTSGETRTSLLQRASFHDAQAWRELVDLYGPLVAHWCRRCGVDVHSTADCLQDVFAAVAVSLPNFTPQRAAGSFRAWLWTITQNKLRDHFRRAARTSAAIGGSVAMQQMQLVVDESSLLDEEPTGDQELRQLTSCALAQIECEFETRTWTAFWRTVVDGVTTDQVARELSMTPASVRQSRSRILRRLRVQLGEVR